MKTIYLILLAVLMGVIISCNKDNTQHSTYPLDGTHHTCDDHVLKEPYILYQGDPTIHAVMIHTTTYIKDFGVVKIKWGTHGNLGSYHDMTPYEFEVDECESSYIWYYNWEHNTHNPKVRISYKVNVHTTHKDHYYEGWFYPSGDNMTDLTFYAFGDTRDGGDDYASVMNAMAYDMDHQGYERGYRLLLNTGDIVFNGGRNRFEPWWNNWNTYFFGRNCNNNGGDRGKAMFILRRVPVLACIGNHDFEWEGNHDDDTRYYFSNWPYRMYRNSTKITLDDVCNVWYPHQYNPELAYYSCDYGPVHFISLSTFPANNDQSTKFGTDSDQYKWLKKDLENNNKPWTIVFTHIPFYAGKGAHNHSAISTCEPLFQQYGVDAVLQGHLHAYIRINADKGTTDEIPYLTLGRGGVTVEHCNHDSAECYSEQLHFARFEVTNNDSLHVLVTEKHLHIAGNIDNFYINNRPKK